MIKFSVLDFLELAFCTKSNIFEIVEFSNDFVTSISTRFVVFINPLRISSPISNVLGIASPVKADVSKVELPFVIFPSNATFSPGFITIISPNFTSFGKTFLISPSIFKFA